MAVRTAGEVCCTKRQNYALPEGAARTDLVVPSSVGGVATAVQLVVPRFVLVCMAKQVSHEASGGGKREGGKGRATDRNGSRLRCRSGTIAIRKMPRAKTLLEGGLGIRYAVVPPT